MKFIELKFPKGFLWGAAASAPQKEGESISYGKSASTWDKWYQIAPELFHNNIGPGRTSNVYNLYKKTSNAVRCGLKTLLKHNQNRPKKIPYRI